MQKRDTNYHVRINAGTSTVKLLKLLYLNNGNNSKSFIKLANIIFHYHTFGGLRVVIRAKTVIDTNKAN